MAHYSIESDVCLGISHSGPVNVEGKSTVELTDDEVKTLVDLIREKGTTDVDALDIATTHPQLYDKLDSAYHDMAYCAEELHWLWEGYYNGYYEYDEDALIDYCTQHCGFRFDYDEQDYYETPLDELEEGEQPTIDEDQLAADRYRAFCDWLDDYLKSLSDDDARRFFYDHMDAGLDMDDDVSYTVSIPGAIIKMANS